MKCSEVQSLLSAYHDGELPESARLRVESHLERCSTCSEELVAFGRLSQMAAALGNPVPPKHLWSRVEEALDRSATGSHLPKASGLSGRWRPRAAQLLALAVAVLVAIGVGWFAIQHGGVRSEHHEFAAEFGHYLVEFRHSPDAAQQFLLAKYESQRVAPEEAIHRVGYRPAVAGGLPPGYQIESQYVIKMPCCTCVQTLCRRADGSALVVFEHNDDDPRWFGDRPAITASCNGERCSLIEMEDRLAATWKHGARYITLVGVRDVTEVSQMVAWLDEGKRSAPY